ncbi:MAG: DUF4168 domain-containing protein [Polyangia bacterium]
MQEQPPGAPPPSSDQSGFDSAAPAGQPGGAGAPPPGGEPGSISQNEIDIFAEIQIDLANLQKQFSQGSPQNASPQELQMQFQQQAEQIIEESDLSLDRYQEIENRVARDPDLQAQVRSAIQQKRGS